MRTKLDSRKLIVAAAATGALALPVVATGGLASAATGSAQVAAASPSLSLSYAADTYSTSLSGLYISNALSTVLNPLGAGSQNMRGSADPNCATDLSYGPTGNYWSGYTPREWCWSQADTDDAVAATQGLEGWTPQGLATTYEADNSDGSVQSQRAAFVAWARENGTSSTDGKCGSTNAVRASFVNLNNGPSTPAYTNVMLVQPGSAGQGVFQASGGHAGGMALYGNYLYVANTKAGIDVYDLRDIIATNSTTNTVGKSGSTITGCTMHYVLPRQATYKYNYSGAGTSQCPRANTTTTNWCFSALSIYRPSAGGVDLVVSEHLSSSDAAATSQPARIALFPMTSGTTAGLGTGTVTDSAEYTDGQAGTGAYAFAAQDTLITPSATGSPQFFFNESCNTSQRGIDWLVTSLNDTNTPVTCNTGTPAHDDWAYRPEGLAYSATVDGYFASPGGVWSNTEGAHPILMDVPYNTYVSLANSA